MEKETLHNSFTNILEESRLMLPGSQTLFGFQLIVVFTEFFQSKLTVIEKYIHFGAMILTIISFSIVLSIVAYHRRINYNLITKKLIITTNELLKIGMVPLAFAIASDFYLVSLVIMGNHWMAILSSLGCLALLITLWLILPKVKLVNHCGKKDKNLK